MSRTIGVDPSPLHRRGGRGKETVPKSMPMVDGKTGGVAVHPMDPSGGPLGGTWVPLGWETMGIISVWRRYSHPRGFDSLGGTERGHPFIGIVGSTMCMGR